MEPQKQNGAHMPTERRHGPRVKKSKAQSPTELVQTMTRYPEWLRARIEEAALESGRSINSEVRWRLERSFWLDDLLKARLISARVPAKNGDA